ncbi:ATP-dependent DNA helicase Q1-like [Octopus vulgaris]|uniref:ATP-dependent DNA helicase n=1 Tax=Octopus vulgaris TaxID=6645 RepID=A0AA36B2A4_OCTVU|nr:ATP-dependent DNA helicase Q1-like [Octopus vulgaris]
MDTYRKELADVKQQLVETEQLLQDVLKRQSALLQKKEELETILRESSSKPKKDDKDWSLTDFKWSLKLKEKMKSVFHIDKLRPLQMETMNVTMVGEDCLLIMPTGGGKSLCFQLPAIISNGITLVVSPLISLVEDQLVALESLKIEAKTLNSSTERTEATRIMNAMLDKNDPLKILYVTPEKLAKSKRFMAKLEKMYQLGRFSRLVIDEVHCCSQWGHDFRPDYKFLGIMKRQFPEVPILGLTATATVKVLNDVKKILCLNECILFRASFNRPNLFYEIRSKSSNAKEVLKEISEDILKKFRGLSGIVYCFSRRESEDVTVGLRELGVRVGCYHSDLTSSHRRKVHRAWLANDIQVIVATVAFGMGIDKPDVRFVIHHSLSKSMENLYQESGRAGRDDKVAHCIIYYRLNDVMRQSTMVFTEQTGIENLYALMEYCSDVSRCRRSMIARHFGETWSSSDCNRMCDNCKAASTSTIKTKNVNKYAADVLTLVKRGRQIEQFHTLTKLVDAWFGKGAPTLRVREIKAPTLTRQTCERIIAMMLLKGYLKEDFHFTPYSTISYIMSGPKSSFITANHEVSLDFQVPSHAKDKSVLSETSSKSEVKSSNKRTSLPVHDVDSENSPPRKISKRPIIIDDDEEEEEESTKNSDSNDFIPQKPTKHE